MLSWVTQLHCQLWSNCKVSEIWAHSLKTSHPASAARTTTCYWALSLQLEAKFRVQRKIGILRTTGCEPRFSTHHLSCNTTPTIYNIVLLLLCTTSVFHFKFRTMHCAFCNRTNSLMQLHQVTAGLHNRSPFSNDSWDTLSCLQSWQEQSNNHTHSA